MITLLINNISMEYGNKQLFSIKKETIYDDDKIGIVGENGTGKTTLLEILAKKIKPLEGVVTCYDKISYIPQLYSLDSQEIEGAQMDYWKVPKSVNSGGEITRQKIATAFSQQSSVLLLDEPTANLDKEGIIKLEKQLHSFKGSILLVSHDRILLNKTCKTIWELKDGKVTIYRGNYNSYKIQKEINKKKEQHEYEKYIGRKYKLENAILDRNRRAKKMKKPPKRMGNSEARLHRMEVRQRAGKVEQAKVQLQRQLGRLEKKDKPINDTKVTMSVKLKNQFVSKTAITVKNLNYKYDEKVVLSNVSFVARKSEKIVIDGENGSGKTTLIQGIYDQIEGIRIANNATVGYFKQNYSNMPEDRSIIDFVLSTSKEPEHITRIVLGRLGIKRDDVYKKIKVLSGGEKCRVSLAALLCGMYNILLLDEPTNYLDLYALEALEELLTDYEGTLVFVSHDRQFCDNIASRELYIKDGELFDSLRTILK